MKMKEIGPKGGVHPKFYYVDLPLVDLDLIDSELSSPGPRNYHGCSDPVTEYLK